MVTVVQRSFNVDRAVWSIKGVMSVALYPASWWPFFPPTKMLDRRLGCQLTGWKEREEGASLQVRRSDVDTLLIKRVRLA